MYPTRRLAVIVSLAALLAGGLSVRLAADPADAGSPALPDLAGHAPHSANPILPGYHADPALLQHEGRYYLYVTLDPWGGATLGCWESADFKNWTYRVLNWPTKAACTSPTSKSAMVWAPGVVRARDGRFYMYVSVGSEIWAGVADHPLGPWRNALGDRPLIPHDFRPGYHMIDAEAFIDDDGQAYLYWGSGWNWVNGKCWAVKLKPDMVTFDGEVRDVTPANFFEAPFMVKRGGRYYLMYSQGKTIEDSYRVHYAVGDAPLGPFTEAPNSPILVTDRANNVVAPGHHAVFVRDGRHYILYHRHSIPFDPRFIGRQICVDELRFTAEGWIERVVPTHTGPAWLRGRLGHAGNLGEGAAATASSQKDRLTGPERALDDNYATRWAAAPDARGAWLQLDLGAVKPVRRQELRLEYAWKTYSLSLQSSVDGSAWQTQADFTTAPVTGSPVVIAHEFSARHLRLVFPGRVRGADIAVFEWVVQ